MEMTADIAHAALLEALPTPALLVDGRGVVQRMNSVLSDWFAARDLRAEELVGRTVGRIAERLAAEDVLTPALESVLRGERVRCVTWDDLEPHGGEPLPGTVRLSPVRDADGTIASVLLLFADATSCADGLSRAAVAVGRAVGNAAHEINNALSLVAGYTELRLGMDLDAALRSDLRNVLDGGRRAARTTEHLGSFARRLRVGVDRMDVNALVGDCVCLVGRTFERGGMMLIEDLSPGLPEARTHAGQAQVVVLSLLLRSLLRLSERMPCGITKVSTTSCADHIAVSVEDEPDSALGDAANRAERDLDELRGSILSLAACRRIAQEYGGELRVDVEGESSRITLHLPRDQGDGRA